MDEVWGGECVTEKLILETHWDVFVFFCFFF